MDYLPNGLLRKESAQVPEFIKQGLLNLGGRDEFGDPVLVVEFDTIKFKEGCWVVKEKWHPSVFGEREDWKEKESFQGEVIDFEEFPLKGFYATVFVWADADGCPLPLSEQLLIRLKTQQTLREEKNVSPEQVALDTFVLMDTVEKQQEARYQEAMKAVAEDLKSNKEKIHASKTRFQSLPAHIKPKNILIH